MTRLEDIVGETVRDLAGNAPAPHDLVAVARARGRRLRRRRRVTIGAATLALAVVAAVPFVLIRPERTALPATPTPAPSATVSQPPRTGHWSEQPYRLPGGAIVTALSHKDVGGDKPYGKTLKDGDVVLDRTTGRYRVVPGQHFTVYGAPVGPHAVVSDDHESLTSVASGKKIFTGGYLLDPEWSPDGTRLLITTRAGGYAIWDATTAELTEHPAHAGMSSCSSTCFYTWLPNGQEIALPRMDQPRELDSDVEDVVVYSAETGIELRVLPITGVPNGWSPDGRYALVLDSQYWGNPVRVVDVRTGATVATVRGRGPRFLPDGRLLSVDDNKAALYDIRGNRLESRKLPADFAGRNLSIGVP
ncbi:WD40 repeat domain-containing protein [Actinoplanes flavus]|uniref:PD40 domain-containing protein n=1 Tax=Actinoplanes flavus TaxID=2820290 RepID=A0ABS3UKQ3_9ACTN|nr:PD40 domain-containing protein [Actinoplanes flavus]MBO3739374.1 PD40 domain-containing protein [Actinoplanes flavus]